MVLANRDYAVPKREFSYLGIGSPGDPSSGHIRDRASRFSIGCTWPRAWEVPGTRVTSLEGFSKALRVGFESEGPTLVEVPL